MNGADSNRSVHSRNKIGGETVSPSNRRKGRSGMHKKINSGDIIDQPTGEKYAWCMAPDTPRRSVNSWGVTHKNILLRGALRNPTQAANINSVSQLTYKNTEEMNSMATSSVPKKREGVIIKCLRVNPKLQHQNKMRSLTGLTSWAWVGHNMTYKVTSSESSHKVGKSIWQLKVTVE